MPRLKDEDDLITSGTIPEQVMKRLVSMLKDESIFSSFCEKEEPDGRLQRWKAKWLPLWAKRLWPIKRKPVWTTRSPLIARWIVPKAEDD